MKIIVSTLRVSSLALVFSLSAFSQMQPDVNRLEKLFGRFVPETQFLFDYTDAYGVNLRFAAKTKGLVEARIAPKYYFNAINPQWNQEPSFGVALSRNEYEKFHCLTRQLFDIGKLVAAGSISVVTNLQARTIDIYEHAVVERTRRDASKEEVHAARIWPMREVSGIVEKDIIRIEIRPGFFMAKVQIDGCLYWIADGAIITGNPTSLKAAGPLDNSCVDEIN